MTDEPFVVTSGVKLTEAERGALRLASKVLDAVQRNDQAEAVQLLNRLGEQYGAEGVDLALICWIDSYLNHLTDGEMYRCAQPAAMTYWETRSGAATQDPTDIPAHILWVGKMITARSRMDVDEWRRMLREETPDHPGRFGSYVLALVETVAMALRLPRGAGIPERDVLRRMDETQ